MTDKQLPPLPTLLHTRIVDGVPCISVSEHEYLMREYVLQAIAHATQPAEVTDEPVYQICRADSVSISTAWVNVQKQQYEDAALYTEYVRRVLYTHPAPGVPDALKDLQIAALVNKVRDIARMFHDHQSLRERIAIELVPALKASQEVKSNAERYRWLKAYHQNSEDIGICKWVDEGWSGQWVLEHDPDTYIDAAMLAASPAQKGD